MRISATLLVSMPPMINRKSRVQSLKSKRPAAPFVAAGHAMKERPALWICHIVCSIQTVSIPGGLNNGALFLFRGRFGLALLVDDPFFVALGAGNTRRVHFFLHCLDRSVFRRL